MRRRARLLTLGLIGAALAAAPAQAAGSPEQELADRYAPVLAFQEQKEECGDGEPYRPISVDAVLGNSDVTLHGPDKLAQKAPTAADMSGLGEGFYLDFPGIRSSLAAPTRRTDGAGTAIVNPVAYAHIATESGRPDKLALQYWFFYVFNDWNNKHESDWEMIQLVFHAADAAAALQTDPYEVAFSQHEGGERAAWDDDKLAEGRDAPDCLPRRRIARELLLDRGLDGPQREGRLRLRRHEPSERPRQTGRRRRSDERGLVDQPRSRGSASPAAGGRRSPASTTARPARRRRISGSRRSRGRRRRSATRASKIPAIHYFGPNVTDFFCGAVTAGSNALIFVQQNPLLALAILAGIVGLVALLLSRTRWSPVLTEPIEAERSIGQILRSALHIYRSHRRLFIGIGVISLPIGVFFTGMEALLFEDLLGRARLTGERSGGGDLLGVGVGGFGALVGAAIVVGTTASTLSSMSQGEVPRVRDVYRAVWARFWLLPRPCSVPGCW